MIQRNKYLIIFIGIAVGLGILSSLGIQKLLPFFVHPTVYYCQQFIHTFSTQMPMHLGAIFSAIIALFFAFILGNIILQAVKIRRYRKKLMQEITSDRAFFSLLTKLHMRKQTVLVSDAKPFAFCFGIRNPKIYISTTLLRILSEKELEGVLLHEAYHLQQKDTITMLIACVSQSGFFFFPLLSDLLRNYRIEQEIKADQHAINTVTSPHTLISALQKLLTTPIPSQLALAAFADEDTLEARIHALIQNRFVFRKFALRNMIVSFFSLAILFLIILTPMQASAIDMHNHSQKATMVCFCGDDCESWCTKHKMIEPYSTKPMVSKNYSSL